MKALLVHHPYMRPRFEQDFLNRVAELPDFDLARADLEALAEGRLAAGGRELDLKGYDAVLIFVAFTALRRAPTLQWRGFAGLRALLDHDVIQNYSDFWRTRLRGAWPPVFRRHRFDLMLTTGQGLQSRLENEGIRSDWLPKAFEADRFVDHAGPRAGLVSYGSAYPSRVTAERALRAAGLPLRRIDMMPYPELPQALASYLACMAISSELSLPAFCRPFLRCLPARVVPIRPGLEPMAKFFEAAGAGCCPIADTMSDLEPLGFKDGETAILFRSHPELVERVRHWLARPEELRRLGSSAARLAHARHTWTHRVGELRDILKRRLAEGKVKTE